MRRSRYLWLAAVLIIAAAFVAGCATSTAPPPATSTTTPASTAVSAISTAAKTAAIDTTINVRFDDMACLNVQEEMGKDYLYPDQKYTLYVSPPGVSGVNVNVLFVDENDNLGLREIEPKWDAVQKKWVYEGIVPLAKFDDVSTPVEKTFTIKTQSKYYICVDDRKETGVNDATIRVPVKLKRIP